MAEQPRDEQTPAPARDELGEPVVPTPGTTDQVVNAPGVVGANPDDPTGAGAQRGEVPGPVPTLNRTDVPPAPQAEAGPPRTDVKPAQLPPVVTGAHAVVLETAAPEPAPAALTKPASRLINVGPGETLSTIARLAYGDENKQNLIWEANRDRLTSPEVLQVGMSLVLPDDPNPDEPAVTNPETPRP